jgi:hypothetical protein
VYAAILSVLAFQRGKTLPAPCAYDIFPRLRHRSQIAFPAAIRPAVPTVTAKLAAAADAPSLSRRFLRIGFVIFSPPLNPAGITAKPSVLTWSPRRLKFNAAIRANLDGLRLACSFFLPLLAMIRHAAAVAAKSPQPAFFPALLNHLAAFRAGIHRDPIIPFGVVVLESACIAAILLPADVARRLKCLPTAQALFLLFHHICLR